MFLAQVSVTTSEKSFTAAKDAFPSYVLVAVLGAGELSAADSLRCAVTAE